MSKIALVTILAIGFAGAAFAEGEGYNGTGDWREIKVEPAFSGRPAAAAAQGTKPVASDSIQTNSEAVRQGS